MYILLLILLLVQPLPVTTHTTSFVAYAGDANQNPPMIFGGKLLAEMDRCAGITVRRFLYASPQAKDAVTIAVNNVRFVESAKVKDLLFVVGTVVAVGEKSITLRMEIFRENADQSMTLLVSGEFVFVAFDLTNKKAISHGLTLPGVK